MALGFVYVLLEGMREQMRGAAYTALKDVDSPEMIPALEDGLSDGSGLVRALAAEALGKLEAGRRSPRLRNALEDQAGLVKATVLKVLGKSGDRSVIPLLEKALKDEQPAVRLAAAGALYHTGQTAMWDTSEYIVAAYTLGLPHPPGNPMFVLIGRVFTILPIAPSIAMRINLLAALSSAVSAGMWFLITERVLVGPHPDRPDAGGVDEGAGPGQQDQFAGNGGVAAFGVAGADLLLSLIHISAPMRPY